MTLECIAIYWSVICLYVALLDVTKNGRNRQWWQWVILIVLSPITVPASLIYRWM